MEIWTGLGLAATAAALWRLMRLSSGWRRAIDGLACTAAVVFGSVAGAAVARTLRNDTVFMTEVHSVLLNEWFLIAGAYMGIYGVAKLAYITWSRQ